MAKYELPHRQLRKSGEPVPQPPDDELPHRQLRKPVKRRTALVKHELPHRQLRNFLAIA